MSADYLNTDSQALLITLGQLLAGEFDNQPQALAEPTWYVHLRLWHRLVPDLFETGLAFFIEQISVASGNPPYRQRLLHLYANQAGLVGQYYGFQAPQAFGGGGLSPERLHPMTQADLVALPSCRVNIIPQGSHDFRARMADQTLGSFEYGGKTTYVSLGFDVQQLGPSSQVEFAMYDKGIDPTTGSATWGALMGPFRLHKQTDFGLG